MAWVERVRLLERHDPRRDVVLELGDVADVGTTECVDRLVGIAHDGEVPVLLGQHREQPELSVVGVLVLVHHDVAEALLPGGAGIGVGLSRSTVCRIMSSKSIALAAYSRRW